MSIWDWLKDWCFEEVTCRLGRVNCWLYRSHNVTCRGRNDHVTPSGSLIDPDRWNGWPRR